jgi:hypothetical protein
MASLLASMSPQMIRAGADDGRPARDDRLRWDYGPPSGTLQALRPDQPFGEPHPFSGDEPMARRTRWQPSTGSSTTPGAGAGARDPDAPERLDADPLRQLAGAGGTGRPGSCGADARLVRPVPNGTAAAGDPPAPPASLACARWPTFQPPAPRIPGGHPAERAAAASRPTRRSAERRRLAVDQPTLFNAMARGGTRVVAGARRL